jgi:hypothetical protein
MSKGDLYLNITSCRKVRLLSNSSPIIFDSANKTRRHNVQINLGMIIHQREIACFDRYVTYLRGVLYPE